MKELWQNAEQWFAGLESRQQVLYSLLSLLLVGFLGYILVVEGAQENRSSAESRKARMADNLARNERERDSLREELATDPNAELEERRETLQTRYQRLQEQLTAAGDFITPRELNRWLRSLLGAEENLTLVSFDTREPEPFLSERENGEVAQVYQHRVAMQLRGDYSSVQHYLEQLQQLPVHFYWQELDYEVREHPEAEVTLRLYTLSLSGRGR